MSSAILVADGNAIRAKRIGEACATRGFTTAFAATGAAALERALAEVPDVVVAPMDLPLIDARRLAEILRANPRTQDLRFLFLGRDPDGTTAGYFDEVLPPSADAEEVGLRVEAMLMQRARIGAVEREASADHEVQGKLSQIPLTDLLQLFHMNGRTGSLELTRRDPDGRSSEGVVQLRDGNVVQSTVDQVDGEKALFRLLRWRDGSFAFLPTRVQGTPRILTPTRALLMEGLRQVDEWDRLRSQLPPLSSRVQLTVNKGELPGAIHPLTQEVLLLLEIYESVQDVVDHCTHPDYQVLRTLQTLVDRGIVRLRRDPDDRLERGPQATLFDAQQVRRLREWLEAGRPRDAEIRDPKLLLFSPDPGATQDFLRLMAGLPGMALAPEMPARLGPEDVATVGRLNVDEAVGIQVIHAPCDARYAPLWPVLAHGALGVVILLPNPEVESSLGALTEALRRLPRARIFHVLLLRKGEKLAADEMQEKIGLLDRASLFLVQLDRGKDPVALLKTMLARVMP